MGNIIESGAPASTTPTPATPDVEAIIKELMAKGLPPCQVISSLEEMVQNGTLDESELEKAKTMCGDMCKAEQADAEKLFGMNFVK